MYFYSLWPWKGQKWPWFWTEVAVKAWRDLATLLDPGPEFFTPQKMLKYLVGKKLSNKFTTLTVQLRA
jgi:hypothetical protein